MSSMTFQCHNRSNDSVALLLILTKRAVVFGARTLLGLGFDVQREGDLPREREHPDPDAYRECDVRCTGRDGLPAIEAEGDRAGQLAARGCDTNLDGVFDCRDGRGSCPLVMRAMLAMRGDYIRADWKRVAVKVTALVSILGTTMQFGDGPVQTLCTARAQRAICPRSQCKSASARSTPCKNILWRLVCSVLFGPNDRSPTVGGGITKGGGG